MPLSLVTKTIETTNGYLVTAIGVLGTAVGVLFWQLLIALRTARESKNEVINTQTEAHKKETDTLREVLPLHTSTAELVQGVLKHLETTEDSVSALTTTMDAALKNNETRQEGITLRQEEVLKALKRLEGRQKDILRAQGSTSSGPRSFSRRDDNDD